MWLFKVFVDLNEYNVSTQKKLEVLFIVCLVWGFFCIFLQSLYVGVYFSIFYYFPFCDDLDDKRN